MFKESPLLTEIHMEKIAKMYRFEKVLGEGAQGKVKVASLRADETKKFAIKSIQRSFFTKQTETIFNITDELSKPSPKNKKGN